MLPSSGLLEGLTVPLRLRTTSRKLIAVAR